MKRNEYEKEHIKRLRQYLSECCVLLRSKGDFPIRDLKKAALYGNGVRHTIKGGTGSGEVNSRYFDTVEKGFERAGITITTTAWLDAYDKVAAEAFEQFKKDLKKKAKETHSNIMMMCMGATMPAPEYHLPLEGDGDTAIYVLARDSGENTDREAARGEILLSETEIRDIRALHEKYEHFMLVLNVGGVVDLSPLHEIENILLLSQLGVETGDVVAGIVIGKNNPSGKLASTWCAWEDYPDLIDFGGYDDTRYKEGIYVGYRYFDTMGVKPLFPFGYGLSYTTFDLSLKEVTSEKEKITVSVNVKNTGAYAGKEVVQLYVSVPSGKLDQPYQALAGFAKTRMLRPDESEEVSISFAMSDVASYDTKRALFILEQGDYILRAGNSSRDTQVAGIVRLDQEIVTRRVKNCLGTPDFMDFVPEQAAESAQDEAAKDMENSADRGAVICLTESDFETETIAYDREYEIDERIRSLSDEDLLHLAMGHFDPRGGLTGVIGNAGSKVAGSAGETAHVDGIKSLIMADGPAGIRISRNYFVDAKGVHPIAATMPESMMAFMPGIVKFFLKLAAPKPKRNVPIRHQYCTAVPIGTAIAQSWNTEFAEVCGDIVGREMEIFHVDLWLAPALNIHRSIRCGRNFEYYSEDPLISGLMAAAMTDGVQKHEGKGVTIKHFAANNQEYNRMSSNSQVSERALREIYLKGFEICVKKSHPGAVMSSYNLINGVHTSERRDLLEDVLRCEFGFDGVVMTDWVVKGGMIPKDAKYASPTPAGVAAAGGDLFMPGSKGDYEQLVKEYKAGAVSRKQLEMNATRLLKLIYSTNSGDF